MTLRPVSTKHVAPEPQYLTDLGVRFHDGAFTAVAVLNSRGHFDMVIKLDDDELRALLVSRMLHDPSKTLAVIGSVLSQTADAVDQA